MVTNVCRCFSASWTNATTPKESSWSLLPLEARHCSGSYQLPLTACVSRRVTMLLSVGCSTESRNGFTCCHCHVYPRGSFKRRYTTSKDLESVLQLCYVRLLRVKVHEFYSLWWIERRRFSYCWLWNCYIHNQIQNRKNKSRSCNSIPLPYPHVPLFLSHFSLATPTSLLFSSQWQCLQRSLFLAALHLKHAGSTRDGKLMRKVQHLLMKWQWKF